MERTHPCRGLCTTSTGDYQCKGCGRTLEEIRDWNTYTPEKKRQLMEELALRVKSSSTGSSGT